MELEAYSKHAKHYVYAVQICELLPLKNSDGQTRTPYILYFLWKVKYLSKCCCYLFHNHTGSTCVLPKTRPNFVADAQAIFLFIPGVKSAHSKQFNQTVRYCNRYDCFKVVSAVLAGRLAKVRRFFVKFKNVKFWLRAAPKSAHLFLKSQIRKTMRCFYI